MDGQKVRHHSLHSSIEGLWIEYLYGDGWRLVEIVLGLQIVFRRWRSYSWAAWQRATMRHSPSSTIRSNGLLTLAIGLARIAGTIINGRWKRSSRLRWTVGALAFGY
jgi:hypothetical protein